VQLQVGAVFKTKPAQRGLRKVPVCKEYSSYSNYRTSFTAEGNLKLVKERTESTYIGTIPPNTLFGPAIEVKFVLIPADNGIDLEPGVAVLVESRVKELKGAYSGQNLPTHVWVNVLKNHVQFANYQGNPVLTQRKIDQQKEQEEKTTLVGARGNSVQTQEPAPLLDNENANEVEKRILVQTADKSRLDFPSQEIINPSVMWSDANAAGNRELTGLSKEKSLWPLVGATGNREPTVKPKEEERGSMFEATAEQKAEAKKESWKTQVAERKIERNLNGSRLSQWILLRDFDLNYPKLQNKYIRKAYGTASCGVLRHNCNQKGGLLWSSYCEQFDRARNNQRVLFENTPPRASS
jgi:hypothetical protein